jgi:uncharacterized protein
MSGDILKNERSMDHKRHKELREAMFMAIAQNQPEALEEALKNGADPRWEWPVGGPSPGFLLQEIEAGETPIAFAAGKGRAAFVKRLLAASNPGARDTEGRTPLIAGALYGDPECAKTLLGAMKDEEVNLRTDQGWSALMAACRNGQTGYVRALIEDGRSDAALRDEDGLTAIEHAIDSSCWDCVVLLAPLPSGQEKIEEFAQQAIEGRWAATPDAFEALAEWIPLERAKAAIKWLGGASMPRLLARVEEAALRDALADGARSESGAQKPGAQENDAVERRGAKRV